MYTWIYFFRHMFKALYAFKSFLKLVKTQIHTKIKALQSDYEGEFRPFTKNLIDLGNSHKLTYPHTSH